MSEPDSQKFAEESRTASAEVERLGKSLDGLLNANAGRREKQLLASFFGCFTNLQRIDRDLQALAVKNTNVRAFALAFGPAAQAAQAADSALSHFLAKHATLPQKVLLLAASAQTAILRFETRLAPHIAEHSDPKMDEMEALMAKDDIQIRAGLDGLAAQTGLRADSDLATARASYARFSELRTQIIALSRENTNVRSLALSLNQKRKTMLLCQDALYVLQQEIAGEPAPVTPSNPRKLRAEPH
jgi:hypothetical protein